MTNLHKNACDESTVAKLLLTEDSIKKFLREFYTNSFRGITLVTLILLLQATSSPAKRYTGVEVGCLRYRVIVEYFPEPAIQSVVL